MASFRKFAPFFTNLYLALKDAGLKHEQFVNAIFTREHRDATDCC